jgi:hypothetical protein
VDRQGELHIHSVRFSASIHILSLTFSDYSSFLSTYFCHKLPSFTSMAAPISARQDLLIKARRLGFSKDYRYPPPLITYRPPPLPPITDIREPFIFGDFNAPELTTYIVPHERLALDTSEVALVASVRSAPASATTAENRLLFPSQNRSRKISPPLLYGDFRCPVAPPPLPREEQILGEDDGLDLTTATRKLIGMFVHEATTEKICFNTRAMELLTRAQEALLVDDEEVVLTQQRVNRFVTPPLFPMTDNHTLEIPALKRFDEQNLPEVVERNCGDELLQAILRDEIDEGDEQWSEEDVKETYVQLATPVSSPMGINRSLLPHEMEVEVPLIRTPPATVRRSLARLSSTLAKEVQPPLLLPMGRERTDYLKEDNLNDMLKDLVGSTKRQVEMEAAQEQLQPEDSTMRVTVPIVEWKTPIAPWKAIESRDLVVERLRNLKWAGLAARKWIGMKSIEMGLNWNPVMSFKVEILEEIVENGGKELEGFLITTEEFEFQELKLLTGMSSLNATEDEEEFLEKAVRENSVSIERVEEQVEHEGGEDMEKEAVESIQKRKGTKPLQTQAIQEKNISEIIHEKNCRKFPEPGIELRQKRNRTEIIPGNRMEVEFIRERRSSELISEADAVQMKRKRPGVMSQEPGKGMTQKNQIIDAETTWRIPKEKSQTITQQPLSRARSFSLETFVSHGGRQNTEPLLSAKKAGATPKKRGNSITMLQRFVKGKKRKKSTSEISTSEAEIIWKTCTNRVQTGQQRRLSSASDFSATTSLDAFMSIRGRQNTEPLTRSSGTINGEIHHYNPLRGVSIDLSLERPLKTHDSNLPPPSQIFIHTPAAQSTSTATIEYPLPAIPFSLPAAAFIVSTTILSSRNLYRTIKKLYPRARFVERDFTTSLIDNSPSSSHVYPTSEADILLSPKTGIILTSLQRLRQRPLPGDPSGRNFKSGVAVKRRILELVPRYERLAIVVYTPTPPVASNDAELVARFYGFAAGLIGECDVIVRIAVGEVEATVMARWIVSIMAHEASMGSYELQEAETTWEWFLRRAGCNAFAAQVVSKISADSGGLAWFLTMPMEERRRVFNKVVGPRVIRTMEIFLDARWK